MIRHGGVKSSGMHYPLTAEQFGRLSAAVAGDVACLPDVDKSARMGCAAYGSEGWGFDPFPAQREESLMASTRLSKRSMNGLRRKRGERTLSRPCHTRVQIGGAELRRLGSICSGESRFERPCSTAKFSPSRTGGQVVAGEILSARHCQPDAGQRPFPKFGSGLFRAVPKLCTQTNV